MEAIPTPLSGSLGAQGALHRETLQLRKLENQVRNLEASANKPGGPGAEDAKLRGVAKQFESLLIHQMMKAMRRTVIKSDLLNSFSLQQYESMLDEEIAKEMAEHKGLGLADMLYHQLRRIDSEAHSQATQTSPKSQVTLHE